MSRSKRQFRGRLNAAALLIQVEVQLVFAPIFFFLIIDLPIPAVTTD